MGLIKTAMTMGTAYTVADKGIKAYTAHENAKPQHQQGQAPPQGSNGYYYPGPSSRGIDDGGYIHQAWCNGQCRGQCNGPKTQAYPQQQLSRSQEYTRSSGDGSPRAIMYEEETLPSYNPSSSSGAGFEQLAVPAGSSRRKS